MLIRSEQVMSGYWGKPEATAEAITPDGWFHSGDAGYLRDGRLYLHDRIKDMIVSGAENVYPAEVENVLMRHPMVVDVAVIGVPDTKWGETVKAVVVLDDGAEATAEELIDHARAELARYKCPTSVDFVAALPRNPSGKVLKRELREPYWPGRTAGSADAPSLRSPATQAVAGRSSAGASSLASATCPSLRSPATQAVATQTSTSRASARFRLPRDGAWIPQPQRARRSERAPLTLGKPEPIEHRERDRRDGPRAMRDCCRPRCSRRAGRLRRCRSAMARRRLVVSRRMWPAPPASVAPVRRSG